jgi:hypothetical protein
VDLNKIAVTLYDVFGYLLPGYVVLLAGSLVESTFFGTWFLSLSLFGGHPVPFAIAAYFMGQVSHAIASWLTESKRLRTVIQAPRERLAPPLYSAVRAELEAAFGPRVDLDRSTGALEPFLLADAYLTAVGAGAERDLLSAREGFFKQSVVAFAVLALVLLGAAVAAGGATVQSRPGVLTGLRFWPTLLSALLVASVAALFRLRFGFYHRVKMNNTMLLFLAHRSKERNKPEGAGR